MDETANPPEALFGEAVSDFIARVTATADAVQRLGEIAAPLVKATTDDAEITLTATDARRLAVSLGVLTDPKRFFK